MCPIRGKQHQINVAHGVKFSLCVSMLGLLATFPAVTTAAAGKNLFSNLPEGEYSIGNKVWIDDGAGTAANANNGKLDKGESAVADGVTMELRDNAGQVITRTTTNGGYYLFSGLKTGDYQVCVAARNFTDTPDGGLLIGYLASTGGNEVDANSNVDGNDNGSDVVADGLCSSMITLGTDEPTGEMDTASGTPGDDGAGTDDALSNLTVDFGVLRPAVPKAPVSVGDYIWIDANNNGQQDVGEQPLAGAKVSLLTKEDGMVIVDSDQVVAPVTTGADGKYRFSNLPEGDYIIRVKAPDGYIPTKSGPDVDEDASNTDSNCAVVGDKVQTPVISLMVGTEPDAMTDGDNTNGNMTVDCGFYKSISLGNRVWRDSNANGKQDSGEPGIANITMTLFEEDGITPATDINGKPVAAVKTDANGNYLFTNLLDGSYRVKVTPPPGYAPTLSSADPNNNDGTDSNGIPQADGSVISNPIDLKWGAEPQGGGASNQTVGFGFIPKLQIPTLSQWGLAIMSLLLAAAGLCSRHRED
jgi:hypothetical protein